jgi:hypothetical protein
MFADVRQRFGCVDCGYFTNIKCNIEKHVISSSHKEKMISDSITFNRKYQCVSCAKIYKSQSGLWSHKKKCFSKQVSEETEKPLKEQMVEMKGMIETIMKNQQPTSIVNNNNNNTINNNYNIFLNEKCGDAIDMMDFIKGIEFEQENFEAGNLLKATATEHTASIFANHLNKMTIYERPIHNFIGEDQNQLIAHYRHNNEWKKQSEIMILDEVYRDFDGDDPKDSLMYYMNKFHERRLEHFNMYHGGKKNYLSTNLNFTTYCEQQIDLVRKILEIVSISPTGFFKDDLLRA